MAVTSIFPSTNDVGTTTGVGNLGSEANLSGWARTLGSWSRLWDNSGVGLSDPGGIIDGCGLVDGGGANLTVQGGEMLIDGYRIVQTGETVALADDTYNWIWATATKTSGLVTGLTIGDFSSAGWDTIASPGGSDPSILLGIVQVASGDIVEIRDFRKYVGGPLVGWYQGNGIGTREIVTGDANDNHRPNIVLVQADLPGGNRAFCISNIAPVDQGDQPGMATVGNVDAATTIIDTSVDIRPRPTRNGFTVGGTQRATDVITHKIYTFTSQTLAIPANDQLSVNYTCPGVVNNKTSVNHVEIDVASWGDTDEVGYVAATATDQVTVNYQNTTASIKNYTSETVLIYVTIFDTVNWSLNDSGIRYHYYGW